MSDRIAVMSDGRVEQIGTPEEIYDRPGHARSWPASSARPTCCPARLQGRDGGMAAVDAGRRGRCSVPDVASAAGDVLVMVRPESVRVDERARRRRRRRRAGDRAGAHLPGSDRARRAHRRPTAPSSWPTSTDDRSLADAPPGRPRAGRPGRATSPTSSPPTPGTAAAPPAPTRGARRADSHRRCPMTADRPPMPTACRAGSRPGSLTPPQPARPHRASLAGAGVVGPGLLAACGGDDDERRRPSGGGGASKDARGSPTGRPTSTRRPSTLFTKAVGPRLQLHRGLQRQQRVLRQDAVRPRPRASRSGRTSSPRRTGWRPG